MNFQGCLRRWGRWLDLPRAARLAGSDAMDTDLIFVEKAPHEKGFAKHFEQHIKPKLLELENERLRALKQFQRRVSFAIFPGAAILYGAGNLLYIVESPTFDMVAFVVGVSFVLLGLLFAWVKSFTLD